MPCSPEILRRYPNQVFVETGTGGGSGIDAALAAGFDQIQSIELSKSLFAKACERFKNNKKVSIIQGDSSRVLGKLISPITTPITFWLDAHYSYGDTAKGDKMTPLIEELRIIASHPIKSHVILIDDRRCLGTADMPPTEAEVIREIMAINPSYQISYENATILKDIIVARIA